MTKKILCFAIIILVITFFTSCDNKNNELSNSYARLSSTISTIEFEPDDYEYLSTDSLNYLDKYIKTIESKQYSYVFIKTGVGENNQMTEISRSQNGTDFYETNLIVANDSFPDSIITKKVVNGEYCEVIDDGIDAEKVKYSTKYDTNGEIEKIFNNLKFDEAFTLSNQTDNYYCESYNNLSDNREYYFIFNPDESLLGIRCKTSNNKFLFYYSISFNTNNY